MPKNNQKYDTYKMTATIKKRGSQENMAPMKKNFKKSLITLYLLYSTLLTKAS